MSKFDITLGKGFHMTFANGYTVSVQWGFGNYCDNQHIGWFGDPAQASSNAEVAIIDPNGKFVGDMHGWQTADEVAAIIARTSALPAPQAKRLSPPQVRALPKATDDPS